MTHFMLVHGAFHGPWCFDPLVAELTRRGAVCTAPELPLTSLAEDAAAVHRALEAVGAGPVVLLGHSYGGAVVTVAGNHPAVGHLVLLASLAPDEGEPPSGGPVEIDASFIGALRPAGAGLLEVDPTRTAELFYPDASPAEAAAAAARLRPGATGLPHERIERAAWRSRPTTYVVCADDPIVLPDSQRAIAARTGAKVVEIPGDHSPFLARPAALAELLLAAVR
ncbi:MAG: alpha/beta hydrolase [Myxococcota bacterium]